MFALEKIILNCLRVEVFVTRKIARTWICIRLGHLY